MLLSLALATALWTIVTNQQNPPHTDFLQSVPVKTKGEPAGLVIRDEIKPVRVKVTAPKDVWERLSSSSFEAYVDVSKTGPGVQDVPVHVEIQDPRVRIEEVQPSKITIRLEQLVRKEIPVRVNITGNTPFGYASKPPKVSPEVVTISGPQSKVSAINLALVEVRLDGLRSSISQPFKPVIQRPEGEDVQGLSISPESVFVEVAVEREVSYKTVPVAPRLAGNASLGYQIVGIMVDPDAVTLVGDPNVLDGLAYLPTKPVDVSNIKGDITAVVEPDLPEGVALARKQSLVVRVYASAVESSQTFRVAPVVTGLNSSLQATVNPSAIDIILSGPMPLLTTIKPQDIKVIVDVAGMDPGVQTMNPTVTVPSGLRFDSISPDKLAVTIR